MDINISECTIHYGDPEGDGAPDWLYEVTNWWLSKHIDAKFNWAIFHTLHSVMDSLVASSQKMGLHTPSSPQYIPSLRRLVARMLLLLI
jgi:hypothetical protein